MWLAPQVAQAVPLHYYVTNTNDSGLGSLRQAITNANAHAGHDVIDFDIAGTGPWTISVATPLPIITDPVTIDATTVSGYAGSPLVDLDGSATSGAAGLEVTSGGTVITGLSVTGFYSAVEFAGGSYDQLTASWIGLTPSLTSGTNSVGVEVVSGSHADTVGSSHAGKGDVISYNGYGVFISGAGSGRNVVIGDEIGTDPTGTTAAPNAVGIEINDAASANHIGGTAVGDGDLISGNSSNGVAIAGVGTEHNAVLGSEIGTTAAGTGALGNATGVYISTGATLNAIGGHLAGDRNLISGNAEGVDIDGAGTSKNVVLGDFVGTDVTGAYPLGNSDFGVELTNSASLNVIGNDLAGGGNVVSSNTTGGVLVTSGAFSNYVEGNFIGTDLTATLALANGTAGGVYIAGAALKNQVGGLLAGQGNTIDNNLGAGVTVDGSSGPGTGNVIPHDSFSNNGGLDGIALVAGGNNSQAAPVIASVTTTGPTTTVSATLTSPHGVYRIELSACDASNSAGQVYLSSQNVTVPALGTLSFSMGTPATSDKLTITATDLSSPNVGNTSEFSNCQAAVSLG
jgi:titin